MKKLKNNKITKEDINRIFGISFGKEQKMTKEIEKSEIKINGIKEIIVKGENDKTTKVKIDTGYLEIRRKDEKWKRIKKLDGGREYEENGIRLLGIEVEFQGESKDMDICFEGNNKITNSGLTEQEQKVDYHIAKACELYNKLPRQHPSDIPEWNFGIHICQGLLMQRITRREYPRYWRNDVKESEV